MPGMLVEELVGFLVGLVMRSLVATAPSQAEWGG